ncbi:MAG: hydrogenase [Planctomycetes bacterium]|nr:hydrogenase [Planctomycetota bacterium]
MSEVALLWGIGIAGVSGVPGLFFGRYSFTGQCVTTALSVAGSVLGLTGVGLYWLAADGRPLVLPWGVLGADFSVAIDGLSAIFLLPVFLVSILGNIYGLGYWKQADHPENGRKLRLFYGVMTAGMALLVIAHNSILFLFGWESMALAAFFLVTTEDHKAEVREVGFIYLIATHVATLSLFALFALLYVISGSFDLVPLNENSMPDGISTAVLILALLGFGLKAGLMPLHVWLPGAHAMAPSHVSAIMSGVIIKMGIYGLARVLSLFPHPPLLWGGVVLGLGVVSGILGVVFAISQHDLKRLLAYHSIENIGIIAMGLGLALIGRSLNRVDWILLGLSGCLLHVWNHALFKSLLFLSAGSVIHAVHTREIDHLGGLARNMPRTALYFLIGAVAICGLPPLNGFISEYLIYVGLLGTLQESGGPSFTSAAFAAPALALIGALAVACFVKVFGAVFLGQARSARSAPAHEAPPSMLLPMAALSVCCFFIGLVPGFIAPLFEQAAAAWAPELRDALPPLSTLVPLGRIGVMAAALFAALFLGSLLLWARLRNTSVVRHVTWGCGYAAATPRMQYTSSSFAQILVGLFRWVLRPRIQKPAPLPLFPKATSFHSEVPDVVLNEVVLPAFHLNARVYAWFRIFQQGSIQAYLLYIFLTLLVLLFWR